MFSSPNFLESIRQVFDRYMKIAWKRKLIGFPMIFYKIIPKGIESKTSFHWKDLNIPCCCWFFLVEQRKSNSIITAFQINSFVSFNFHIILKYFEWSPLWNRPHSTDMGGHFERSMEVVLCVCVCMHDWVWTH